MLSIGGNAGGAQFHHPDTVAFLPLQAVTLCQPIVIVAGTQYHQIVVAQAGDHPQGHAEALLQFGKVGVQ